MTGWRLRVVTVNHIHRENNFRGIQAELGNRVRFSHDM